MKRNDASVDDDDVEPATAATAERL